MSGKRWTQKASLTLLGLFLPVAMLELAARTYAKLTFQERTITSDSTLGWKLIPFSKHYYQNEAQAYHIEINSKGLRDREHSYDKPAGVFRIVVLGDSFVFGSGGVEASDRSTDIIEKSAENLEVINMGVPAYGTDQEYLYLKTEGFKYHPDLVILCAFANDFTESFQTLNSSIGRPKGYFSLDAGHLAFHPPSLSFFYLLTQQSYLLGWADLELSRISRAYRSRSRGALLDSNEETEVFKQLFISARDLCRAQGAEFVLVYFPYEGQKQKNIIQQVMKDVAAREGIKTLDLMEYMLRVGAKRSAYFKKDIHFNEYGHRVVAEALRTFIVKETHYNSPTVGWQ